MARGDHVYVNRIGALYNHHGIDCGDGTVVHYTSRHWRQQRRIARTELEDFCRGDELRVRNYQEFEVTLQQAALADKLVNRGSRSVNQLLDSLRGLPTGALDFSPDAVTARALSRVGESRFDIVSNNCEHFAAWCKTGLSGSDQIDAVWRSTISGPRFLRRRVQHLLTETFERPWGR
jgi:hypothetical protein